MLPVTYLYWDYDMCHISKYIQVFNYIPNKFK